VIRKFACAVLALCWSLCASAQVDLDRYIKQDTYGAIKISPTGEYYAAVLNLPDRSVLMIQRRSGSRPASTSDGGDIRIPREGKSLAEIEREAVRITLQMTGGNQAAAARLLRISRPTLAKKMHEGRKPEPAHS
jgi:DNA-binding NtrC family response regulator